MQALKMKDEQLRILSDQNRQLLGNLDKVEEDANNIQMEKLAVEEENRSLRDVNFELQVRPHGPDSAAVPSATRYIYIYIIYMCIVFTMQSYTFLVLNLRARAQGAYSKATYRPPQLPPTPIAATSTPHHHHRNVTRAVQGARGGQPA